jgi:hypothetical protein
MNMLHRKCKTIEEAMSVAIGISLEWGNNEKDPTTDVWFRGAKAPLDLLPSAYRKDIDELSSIVTFNQLVRNMTITSGFDDWDYYCLARHHGIPTRLLDWTEGFVQALFFAFDGWDGLTQPCIWMIRPHLLNKTSVGEEYVYTTTGNEDALGKATSLWLTPISLKKKCVNGRVSSNENPIAVFPARSNPRIIGQLSTFTIHGVAKTPLNVFLESQPDPDQLIARIDLVDFDEKEIKRCLKYLGLRQAVIYPDPDHLAKDIRYDYGW